MSDSLLAGQSSIWVQPDGPNTTPRYLGCHGITDVTEPMGDVTLTYCPDPAVSGSFLAKNGYQAAAGSVTTSIETVMYKVADYLESLGLCTVPIYIMKVSCGRRDTFSNFDRAFVLRYAKVTSRKLGNVAARVPTNENETTQSFDISAREMLRIFKLQATRVALVETEDLSGLAICGEQRCEGTCGATQKSDDYMWIASKALVGSASNKANVWYSDHAVVYPTIADPFAIATDIQGVVCFKMDSSVTRVLVGLGTTDAGAGAKVAYTDDSGTTWTTVTIGSTVGEFISNGHAIFALDRYHIWAATSGGRIYFSSDGAASWTRQENAAISATAITGISFVDTLTGFAVYTGGGVAKCIDGEHWSAATTSGATTTTDIKAISKYEAWVTGANGIYCTMNEALTWTNRSTVAMGAIDFLNELYGMAVGSAASGLIYVTINGGNDWSPLALLANAGMNEVAIVSPSVAYVGGKASGGTAFLAKVVPQS